MFRQNSNIYPVSIEFHATNVQNLGGSWYNFNTITPAPFSFNKTVTLYGLNWIGLRVGGLIGANRRFVSANQILSYVTVRFFKNTNLQMELFGSENYIRFKGGLDSTLYYPKGLEIDQIGIIDSFDQNALFVNSDVIFTVIDECFWNFIAYIGEPKLEDQELNGIVQ